MIVTQPKGMSSGSQSTATKIIPTKIVYGQQGKTQVRPHQLLDEYSAFVHLSDKFELLLNAVGVSSSGGFLFVSVCP